LIAQAKTQQNMDINRIVRQYHTTLLRLAFFYLKDQHLAEDAVQETFIRIYKYQNSFSREHSEKAWINQIAINVCKSLLQSSWIKKVDPVEAHESIAVEDETAKVDDTVVLEIMKLPVKYKEVILLFYYQDLKVKDVAHVLGISQNTVSVRLARARRMLQKRLKGWYFDE
jgi:RNA polymerase sigma-70 factor (ECF subfamily)